MNREQTSAQAAPPHPKISGYEYLKDIGRGGSADILLYRQATPNRLVAVKVLRSQAIADSERQQFLHEVNRMAELSQHPAMLTLYGADFAQDFPYLITEYCPAGSLARYLSDSGRHSNTREVLKLGVRLASALETAHRAGILHRDIKPDNILTTDFGWPALTDFGISSGKGDRSQPSRGVSVQWAAPEVLAVNSLVDERSDIYSLAATLFAILEGAAPYAATSGSQPLSELIDRIHSAPVPRLSRPDTPPSLSDLLERSMAKDPSDRPQSMQEFARQLQYIEMEEFHSTTPMELQAGKWPLDQPQDDATASPESAPSGYGTAPETPRSSAASWWLVALSAVIVALVVIGIVFALRQPPAASANTSGRVPACVSHPHSSPVPLPQAYASEQQHPSAGVGSEGERGEFAEAAPRAGE